MFWTEMRYCDFQFHTNSNEAALRDIQMHGRTQLCPVCAKFLSFPDKNILELIQKEIHH